LLLLRWGLIAGRIAIFVDKRLRGVVDIFSKVARQQFLRLQLPIGNGHLRFELLDRALGHSDRHEVVEGTGRRRSTEESGYRLRIVSAHPDAGRDSAGKAYEPTVVIVLGRAGFPGHRPTDLRRTAGTAEDGGLQKVGHFGRNPGRDQDSLLRFLVPVNHCPIGRRHL
jgi:hypothetical protein